MKPPLPSILRGRLALSFFCALFLDLFLIDAISARVPPQEPTPPATESVADAARKARERRPDSDSSKSAKVLTNDDLSAAPASAPATPVAPSNAEASQKESTPRGPSEAAKPICPNASEEQINSELQAAQDELTQLRSELSANGPVISNGDVDLSNFKPGFSGVSFGSPPLLESTPQAPGRVKEVELEEKVAALKKAARIACDSPQEAKIQEQLDSAESQLKLLLQQFNLDQSAYYSKPAYAGDTAGKAKLDAEQQQIQALQEEVDRLRDQLPPENAGVPE
jgi:cytoskeletal protein RodZ